MTTATFGGGYGNLYGDYWRATAKGWLGRVPGQADKIEAILAADPTDPAAPDGLFFVAVELHAEHNAHFPLMTELGDRCRVAPGNGGNLLLHRPELTVLTTSNLLMPGNRWMTKWNVRHTPTGIRFWIVGAHLIAGTDKGGVRAAQARYLVERTRTLHRAILGADLNSYTDQPGYPHAILDAGGWRSIRGASERPVVNAALDSHGGAQRGQWIEGLFVKDLVTVRDAAGVPTEGLSDHTLWFRATFAISAPGGAA
jgi:hypothetical protein